MIYFCKICNEPIEKEFFGCRDIPPGLLNVIMETVCQFHLDKLVPYRKRDLLTSETFNLAIVGLLTRVAKASATGQVVGRCRIIGKGRDERCRNLAFVQSHEHPMICGAHRGVLKLLNKNLDYYDLSDDAVECGGGLTAALHAFFAYKEKAVAAR